MIELQKCGYISIYAFGLMSLVALLLLSIFTPINNENIMILNNIKDIEEFYREQAGLERLVSIYSRNISYSKDIAFDDLGIAYKIEEIDVSQEDVVLNTGTSTGRMRVPFFVNNDTDINIRINVGLITLEGYCDVEIYAPSGEKIVSTSIGSDRNYKITDIYDPETDTWGYGYGEYIVEVDPVESYASVSINYDRVTERTVKVTNTVNNKEFAFKITNNEYGLNSVSKIKLEE